jgi:cohesin domain-containing protein
LRVRLYALMLGTLTSVVVLGAAAGLRDASATGSATVQITPASSYVQIGDEVDVYVEAQNVTPGLGVYEFRLTYSPAVLELVGVANVDFLGSTGRSTSCRDDSDPATATVGYHCNTSGVLPPGPTGSGRLAQIRFKAIANGDSPLHFTKIELDDALVDGMEITDYGEGVIRVGAGPTDDNGTDGGSGNGGGGSSSNAATPTKVPFALTPIPRAAASATPELADDFYDPNCARQISCAAGSAGAGAAGRPSGTPSGTLSGQSQSGTGSTGASGESFPVAGSGPPTQDGRISTSTLQGAALAGGLLIFLGVMIARRRRQEV